MLKFLRIICIWICCAFCLLERIQLPAATAAIAAPFEYFEDHDQLSYDLDTEQSKAKYDTRLLSEQMLKSEKSTERYESADNHAGVSSGIGGSSATNSELDDDIESEADADVDDLQPHERAASCHNNGHKYTHGQKVPRLDPCEVCLCMDGEIFCWWELCAKTSTNQIKSGYHSILQLDTSTARFNEMSSTSGTTVYPTVGTVKLQQQYQESRPYGISLDLSSSKHEHLSGNNKNYQQKVQETSTGGAKLLLHTRTTKSWQKKKTYLQQQRQKHDQVNQHQHKHTHDHTLAEVATGNVPYYAYHPPSPMSASKILSFPENLPSVLYHDYRTEEHQHHQHQHRQQHLKHQQKKLQLQKQRQQQQQLQRKQQMQQHTHSVWKSGEHQPTQHQHDTLVAKSVPKRGYASASPLYTGRDTSNTNWGLVDGNENVYDDTDSDSDILPEPPTKKPKMTATTSTAMATMTATTTTPDNIAIGNTDLDAGSLAAAAVDASADVDATGGVGVGTQASGHVQLQERQQSDNIVADNEKSLKMNAADESSFSFSPSSSSTLFSSTPPPSSSAVVNVAAPVSPTSTEITGKTAEHQEEAEFNRESSEEDQDDAFHRWLTSTEMNSSNKNNNSNSLEGSVTPARPTNLSGLTGAKNINETSATKSLNGTKSHKGGNNGNSNRNRYNNNNNSKIGNVYFRSSYNDYSSEYNGSVVNIDILLTTADEQQQTQQQHQQQQADLITQPSSNSQQTTGVTATVTAEADAAINISSSAVATNTTTLPIVSVQTNSPERQCNVMGTLYKIGDVLPQDTGNCLQCVCIDGSTSDDTPRVTCSPHNCPPLVLPDLFDATGY
ncbi:hybrid signal transduction histidine kinase L [Anastrepha ludens]|uniref:hybrid signal transduction histidine kinase L n=1 Tax=Anastrepha ludens TaxID=28586 RepID=UPI0023AF9D99|nr:hybrid signal transduction histidine kinase L [Anastrepha ludens]XP_053965156.1 hybrid signal transduction histidine kinase L [Anastrepha ludens]